MDLEGADACKAVARNGFLLIEVLCALLMLGVITAGMVAWYGSSVAQAHQLTERVRMIRAMQELIERARISGAVSSGRVVVDGVAFDVNAQKDEHVDGFMHIIIRASQIGTSCTVKTGMMHA